MIGLGRYTTRFKPGKPGEVANPGSSESRVAIGLSRGSRVSRGFKVFKGELISPARRRYFYKGFELPPATRLPRLDPVNTWDSGSRGSEMPRLPGYHGSASEPRGARASRFKRGGSYYRPTDLNSVAGRFRAGGEG